MTNPINQQLMTFSVKKCQCTAFYLTDFAKNNKIIIADDKYNFTIRVGFNFDDLSKTIKFNIDATLSGISEIKDDLATIETVQEFLIVNYEEIVGKNSLGQSTIPTHLVIPLISICLSVIRGMCSVKLENTIYSNAILPLLDASKFVPPAISPIG